MQYMAALAVLPSGQAKDDGVQVGKAAANSINIPASGRWPRCECALQLSVRANSRSLDSDPAGAPFAANPLGRSDGAFHDD